MKVVKFKNNVSIRLPEERWFHITEEHSEMAGYYFEVLETVEEPEAIYEGKAEECIAVREIEKGKYIVVIYRELNEEDGFVITAFLTRRRRQLERRRKIWEQ
jgi:hypothetical protein